ncbi:MAG: hypothetical protein LWW85_07245 [Marinilabiliales bacterium]|nr:hypothetical protein [Marinilabiliales bacterium]
MEKIQRLYRDNINAILVTLLLHLIVLGSLLFAQMRNNHELPETALFVDMVPIPIKEQLPEKALDPASTSLQEPYAMKSGGRASNRAYNLSDQSSKTVSDPFFDKTYAKEVAAAKQLASDVNKNLSRKIPEIGDVPMPVASTEGMTPEEARRSTFKGKSNIRYLVGKRYHVQLPIPVYLAQGGGEVTVEVVVNRAGDVISALPRENNRISDPTIFAYAKQAAEKTLFNEDASAPEKEKGTITYVFVAQ